MSLPKRQHSKQRGRKRRTHWKVAVPSLSVCPQCKKSIIPHRVCPFCGYYKGKQGIEFKVKEVKEAMEFVDKVAAIAEEEGHHPNIYLYSWNKVRLELYTHAIGGLHENDFVIAAKVNGI